MSLTVNLTQLKRKKRRDGTIPIYIRITENRKSRYKSTGISVFPKDWNSERHEVRRSHRDYKKLNRKLQKQLREFQEKRDELEQKEKLSLCTLKETVTGNTDPDDLIQRMEAYHNSLEGTERYHEWKKVGVVLNNLKDFMGNSSLSVNEVDAGFIEDFQQYLLTEVNEDEDGNPIGNNPNTVRRKLKSLRGMFMRLLKNKEIKNDPFAGVNKVSKNSVSRTKLTLAQIKRIEKLDLEPRSKLWHVRNYFMYSFYNAGIRFGDLCTLTWSNLIDGRLRYTMSKTGGKKSIKQLEPMQKILDLYRSDQAKGTDYIFPILDRKYDDPFELRKAIGSKNAIVNLALKALAEMAEIDESISFHVSRHSFSHFALKKGMDLYSISKALGHSDLKTTQQYLKKFDEELLDESMNNLFS